MENKTGMTDQQLSTAVGIKTFQLIANVSGFMPGEIDDWPANIQDAILEALDKKAAEVELPLMIVFSMCEKDWGSSDSDPKFYVCVIASEIVVADDRFFRDEKAKMKAIIADIVAGRRH